jgi:cell wall-associated NlpC family hydrolase
MSSQLDPKRYAYRQDLAADTLSHLVRAARYVTGVIRQVKVPSAPLRRSPQPDAPLDTEALCGEKVMVFEDAKGWSWVQLKGDGYVGYMPSDALRPIPLEVTHKISALRGLVFSAPDIKSPPLKALSFSAHISCTGAGKFLRIEDGGFIHLRHASNLNDRTKDFVTVAERFLGTPYLWGGKTSLGIDCSGLIQVAMQSAGHFCPRDSYMQAVEVGVALEHDRFDLLKRGDLIFWKGHVGVMLDNERLLHANAHYMEVSIEPLAIVVVRQAASGNPIQVMRRPAALGL